MLSAIGLAWLVVPIPFAAVLGYQGWFASTLSRYRARAFACLDAGDYEGAAAVYDELARKRHPRYKVAGIIGLASVAMRSTRPLLAEALLAELLDNPGHVPALWRDVASEYLAIGSALAGDLERAERQLDIGDTFTPVTFPACAVVEARAGHWQEVLALERPALRHRDARLFAHELRLLHLMRAFAAEQTGEPSDDDRMLARPAFDTEFEYLVKRWPELRDYLEQHPLSSLGVADDAIFPRARLVR